MNRNLALPGLAGILVALVLYAIASTLSTLIPSLLQGNLFAAIVFALCLALSLIEIPMMIFGLRQMGQSATTSRRLVTLTFAFFVMFAGIYAAIFVLLTGQILWGVALVALCFVRFASGVIVR